MKNKITMAVCLPLALKQWLSKKSNESGVSVSSLVSQAVYESKKREDKDSMQ